MRTTFLAAAVVLVACGGEPEAGSASGHSSTGDDSGGTSFGTDDGTESEAGSAGTVADDETAGSAGGDDDDPFGDTGGPMSGPMLYATLCAPCHGNDAQGTALGYELRHPDREYSRWVVRNGRGGDEFPDSAMAAYDPAVVSDAQLDEMFDWLDAFEQPTTGEGLYLDYCRNCHGVDPSAGGVAGEGIDDKDFDDALEAVREGKGGTSYGMRAMYMTALPQDALSDDELMAITAWFAEG